MIHMIVEISHNDKVNQISRAVNKRVRNIQLSIHNYNWAYVTMTHYWEYKKTADVEIL